MAGWSAKDFLEAQNTAAVQGASIWQRSQALAQQRRQAEAAAKRFEAMQGYRNKQMEHQNKVFEANQAHRNETLGLARRREDRLDAASKATSLDNEIRDFAPAMKMLGQYAPEMIPTIKHSLYGIPAEQRQQWWEQKGKKMVMDAIRSGEQRQINLATRQAAATTRARERAQHEAITRARTEEWENVNRMQSGQPVAPGTMPPKYQAPPRRGHKSLRDRLIETLELERAKKKASGEYVDDAMFENALREARQMDDETIQQQMKYIPPRTNWVEE